MVKKELIEIYMQYKKKHIYTEAKRVEDFIEVFKLALKE